MRLASDDKRDPGYPLWRELFDAGKSIDIYLNGERVDSVCLADDERGCIERTVKDHDGNMVIDHESSSIAFVRLYGDVRIVIN